MVLPMFNYFMTSNPTLPKFYWEVESQEQLIAHIWCYLDALKDYINNAVEFFNELEERVTNIESTLEILPHLEEEIATLKVMMQALAQNALVYDVTMGLYRPSMATSRRMWQAGHYYGMLVSDLAQYTVEEASEFNVRHVAVDGRAVYMESDAAPDAIPTQLGYSVPTFIPDDYIKKSDLTYIDSDNLQERSIMGVLDTDAQSKLIKPTPYMRKYTAHDLNNSWVLYNDHVVADIDGECEV